VKNGVVKMNCENELIDNLLTKINLICDCLGGQGDNKNNFSDDKLYMFTGSFVYVCVIVPDETEYGKQVTVFKAYPHDNYVNEYHRGAWEQHIDELYEEAKKTDIELKTKYILAADEREIKKFAPATEEVDKVFKK